MYSHPQPTPPGISTGRKIFLGVGATTIVVLLGAIALVIVSPSGDDSGADSEQTASATVQDQSASAEPQSQPDQDEEEAEATLGIGDSFEAEGFSVTVDEVSVSTDPIEANLFNETHDPDGKWVIVKYTVTNVDDDPEFWYQTIRVRTDEGRSYAAEDTVGTALSYEENGEVTVELNPDDSAIQHAVVDIPEDTEPDQVEFSSLMGNSTVVSLDD